ncbi:hypothetical protein D3C76_1178650 [compost metagenome]
MISGENSKSSSSSSLVAWSTWILMFSRKSVRSTNSLRERHEDSISCSSLACRMTSICLLSFLSSSTIMLSTSALLTGSLVAPLSRMLAIRAATPCLATL